MPNLGSEVSAEQQIPESNADRSLQQSQTLHPNQDNHSDAERNNH
jgi:hypothetical protein